MRRHVREGLLIEKKEGKWPDESINFYATEAGKLKMRQVENQRLKQPAQ
jgi:hypothetical protein